MSGHLCRLAAETFEVRCGPASASLSPLVLEQTRRILSGVCDAWAEFTIADQVVYLGCTLGPGAVIEEIWSPTFAKMSAAVKGYSKTGADAQTSLFFYRTRALPIMSYKMQYHDAPATVATRERYLFASAWRCPASLLSHAGWLGMGVLGGPVFPSIQATSAATLMRTALFTTDRWRDGLRRLRRAI